MRDAIIPVYLAALRTIYVDHLTDLTGTSPSIEDWYRFERAVRDASLVNVRELTPDDLFDAAVRHFSPTHKKDVQ